MLPSLFVTGTDTNVGKTLVSAILSAQLESYYWKPVQTGTEDTTDSQYVKGIIPEDKVFPESYRFSRPLSPNQASSLEGVEISLERVMKDWESCPKPVVVEGAGGVLVPINSKQKMIDLMEALGLPVILVARSTLGTINHTLLSLEVLQRRGIRVAGIVLSGVENKLNQETIRFETNVPVLTLDKVSNVFVREELIGKMNTGELLL